jgi:hypothetical protein
MILGDLRDRGVEGNLEFSDERVHVNLRGAGAACRVAGP